MLPHGVTTAIWDPHEIANVLGEAASTTTMAAVARTAMDIRVNLSSCVPATEFETAGARLTATDLLRYASHPKVIGLAEFMNYPGVLAGDPGRLAKLAAFSERHIDGHAPLLRGLLLNGYIAAGVRTDHEATTAEEALEKIRKGMTVLIREGLHLQGSRGAGPVADHRNLALSGFSARMTGIRWKFSTKVISIS